MLNTNEMNTIEYKREYTDKVLRNVVGFLNYHLNGNIYIGVDDDGTVVGVEDIDQEQLRIKDKIKDGIFPSTLGLFDIIVEKIEGKDVIHIFVSSGNEKPYCTASQGMTPKGCFIRVGSSTQSMTQAQIENMYAKRTRNSLKNLVAPNQNLTFAQLRIYYEEKYPEFNFDNNFAKTLELLTLDGEYNYIAYLLADKNNASVRLAKYGSVEKFDAPVEYPTYEGSLIKTTEKILDKLDVENPLFTRIPKFVREEKRAVDPVALREVVVNAFVHNDYSRENTPLFEIFPDRFEITSYGGLVQGLEQEEFFQGVSDLRNRELMRIFKDIGLVERLGLGMKRILKKYPKSIFHIMPNSIRAVLPFEKGFEETDIKTSLKTDIKTSLKTDKQILELIKKDPKITIPDIAKALEMSVAGVRWQIENLKQQNTLKRIGAKKGGYWEVVS